MHSLSTIGTKSWLQQYRACLAQEPDWPIPSPVEHATCYSEKSFWIKPISHYANKLIVFAIPFDFAFYRDGTAWL